MNEILLFLDDAIASLTRASGLSIAFAKAAADLASQASAQNLLQRIREVVPDSAVEVKKLHEAGVRLYNTAKRGPANDVYVLQVQVVACEAMVGAKGIGAAEDSLEDVRTLDAMRCFSRTGVLLMGVAESSIARLALKRAVDLLEADPLSSISRTFGSSQEAHDCGSAFFAALSGLCSVDLDDATSERLSSIEREHRLIEIKRYLFGSTSFLSVIHSEAQLALRTIVERGIVRLPIVDSIVFQKWLFEDWEDFSSSSPSRNCLTAARLAYSFAKVRDTNAAIAVLERARGYGDVERTSEPCSIILTLKECAVVNCKLRDELRITRLIPGSESMNGSETKLHMEERASSLQAEVFKLLCDCAEHLMVKKSAELYLDHLLDLVAEVLGTTGSFEHTYAILFERFAGDPQKIHETVMHILNHGGNVGLSWAASDSATPLIVKAVECLDGDARSRMVRMFWNKLCERQTHGDWVAVKAFAAVMLTARIEDQDIKARGLLAQAMACMHLQLPDRDGEVRNELKVLIEIRTNAREAMEAATSSSSLKTSAVILDLKCLIRQSILDPEGIPKMAIIEALKSALNEGTIKPCEALEIPLECIRLGTQELAIGALEHLRTRLLSDSDTKSLREVVKRLVVVHLDSGMFCEAAEDVSSYFAHVSSLDHSDEDEEVHFRRILIETLLAKAKHAAADCGMTLESALPIFALMRCAGQAESDSSKQDEILTGSAGYLLRACIAQVMSLGNRTPQALLLLSFAGEKAAEVLASVSQNVKQRDPRIGIGVMFSSIFMASTVADSDEDVAERVVSVCDEGEYAFPDKPRTLEVVASYARLLQMKKTSRTLLVRAVQSELVNSLPDYDRVVSRRLTRLVADSEELIDVQAWSKQIVNIAAVAKLSPSTMEAAALSLWRKRHLGLPVDLLVLAIEWLESACAQDSEISARRLPDLGAMRAAIKQYGSLSASIERHEVEVSSASSDRDHQMVPTSCPTVLPAVITPRVGDQQVPLEQKENDENALTEDEDSPSEVADDIPAKL